MKRSHPAHRMSQYGQEQEFEPYNPTIEDCSLSDLIRELAGVPTPSETPNAQPDELVERMIKQAREWVMREDRTTDWILELSK